jgi:hypothetical protein
MTDSLDRICHQLRLPLRSLAHDHHTPEIPDWEVIGSMLTLWGIILMFVTLAKNFAGMMALRIIPGKSKILILLY